MRISFDLDGVLFVPPDKYETEPVPKLLHRRLFPERLRKETPELIHTLQERGYEIWIYTSSIGPFGICAHYFGPKGSVLTGL